MRDDPVRGLFGVALVDTVNGQAEVELFLRLGVTASASDRVLLNEIGDPMRPDSVGQAIGRLVKAVGVPTTRLHDLRYTHASHLLMAGINVKVVSERLGHNSVSFTLATYTHVMPGQQAEGRCSRRCATGRLVTARHGFIDESVRPPLMALRDAL